LERPHNRICVRLVGGLGNQLFQAAAGMCAAHRLNAKLIFDISSYKTDKRRTYELEPFAHEAQILDCATPSVFDYWRLLQPSRKSVPPNWNGKIWQQSGFTYDDEFEQILPNTYLIGYFQSPNYFSGIEPLVRKAFNLEPLCSEIGRKWQDSIQTNSAPVIGIHLRRGDFISDPKAAKVHNALDYHYYKLATYIARRLAGAKARFMVVSDDHGAAKEFFSHLDDIDIVTGTNMFDDMHLLGQCHYRIIANSSFSWWAAWLGNQETSGLTIAPRWWFTRQRMMHTPTCDLTPDGWVIV